MCRSLLTLICIFIGYSVYPCICTSRSENPNEHFEQEWNSVDYVMEVKITKLLFGQINNSKPKYIDKDSTLQVPPYTGDVLLEAQILKVHKGKSVTKTIKIFTVEDGGAMCHYQFEIGAKYLFYGYQNEETGYYETTLCNRTAPLNKSQFDLNLLKGKS